MQAQYLKIMAFAAFLHSAVACSDAFSHETVEIGFSPGNAEDLVIQTIRSASKNIRVLAYSFTSRPIAKALLDAHKRGVDIMVVVDESQRSEKYTSASFLANSGIPVRVDDRHAIMHSKVIVVDGETVQTGSFNFTSAAATRNAENVVVLKGNPKIAGEYLKDWMMHWQHSVPYDPRY